MPLARFLQSAWLTAAGAALALALADPAQNLYHPSVLLTARAVVVLWFVACALMLRRGLTPLARQLWVLGAAMHVVHVLFAFGLAHGWSHGHAYRRVEEVGGFGEGIFVSHAFAVVWCADVLWWCVTPAGYARRPAWVRIPTHGFLAFVVFNSTVVFAPPPTPAVSAVLFGGLGLLLWWRSTVRTAGPAPGCPAAPAPASPSSAPSRSTPGGPPTARG